MPTLRMVRQTVHPPMQPEWILVVGNTDDPHPLPSLPTITPRMRELMMEGCRLEITRSDPPCYYIIRPDNHEARLRAARKPTPPHHRMVRHGASIISGEVILLIFISLMTVLAMLGYISSR